ncbi:MAG TPA: hypothetical protein VFT42_01555 [Solirubrobacteraceae bacterium]|nr:hypothetical protein [Solirubrobacteraceae bacterium]
MVEVREEVVPRWVFRLPGGGPDGVLRRRGGVLERLLHAGGEPVVVRVAQTARDRVLLGAQAAHEPAARHGIARMRFALGLDDDLRPFHDAFRDDPLIGASVRARPHLRPWRRPEPFEALAWAVCEQLIEFERAVEIERRIVRRLGRRCEATGLRDLPTPQRLAGTSPALLQSMDLAAGRALALRRAAREVAAGRADLHAPEHERAWRRLRAIPGIGSWTVDVLAFLGQGRHDRLPAGDLAFRKLVGRIASGGDPRARASEEEVRAFFAPYGAWAGLAGLHALGGGAKALTAPAATASPARAGTRRSSPPPRLAAA